MKEQNIYELINDELNSIIENYIVLKTIIYTFETLEKVISYIQQGKRGDNNV